MIYKTRKTFKKLERPCGKLTVTKDKGYKIKVQDHNFFVDEDFNTTEEITGLQVPYRLDREIERKWNDSLLTLEEIEQYLEKHYETIINQIPLREKEGLTIKQVEEQNGES